MFFSTSGVAFFFFVVVVAPTAPSLSFFLSRARKSSSRCLSLSLSFLSLFLSEAAFSRVLEYLSLSLQCCYCCCPLSLFRSRALVVCAVMRAFSCTFCRRFPHWNPTVGALTKGRWVRARGLGAGAVAAGLAARVQQNAETVLLLSPRDKPVVFRAARRDGPLHERARRPRRDVQRAHEHRPGAARHDPGRVPALAEAGARPRSACARGRAHNRENSAAVPASLLVSRFRRR